MPRYGDTKSIYSILHNGLGFNAKESRKLETLRTRREFHPGDNPLAALARLLESDYLAAQIWEKL